MLAGHETTANSLAWAWERLVRNPEPHAALVEAVRRDEGAEERVEATIIETMRYRPVIPIIGRRVQVPWRLGDYARRARHRDRDDASSSSTTARTSTPTPSPSAPSAGSAASPAPTTGSPSAEESAAASAPPWRWPSSASSSPPWPAASTSIADRPEPERAMHRNVTMIPARGARVVIAAKH